MLDNLLKEYFEIQIKEEELSTRKSELKNLIIEEMGDNNKYISPDNVSATLTDKETFKYTDELSIINYLKKNKMENFIVEKVNAVALNKELKKKTVLSESLKPYYTKTTSTSLTIK